MNTVAVSRFLATVSVAMALAACGGGGGASEDAPDVKTPSGTLAASTQNCPVLENQDTCVVTLTARSSDVTTVVVVDDDGITYPVTPNTNATITVEGSPGDQKRFRLRANGQTDLGDEVTVSWACATGTYVDDQNLCRSVLRYENTVYGDANRAKNSIRIQGDTCATVTVELTKNETPYQENFIPLSDRFHYYKPLPSGRVLVSALVTKDLVRNFFVVHPITNATTRYEGEEGAAPSLTDPGWIATSSIEYPDPAAEIGTFAETKDWMVYITIYDSTVLYCKDNATGVVTVLPGTDPDIQYRSLTSYRN